MEIVNKEDHHKVKGIILLMEHLFGHFVFGRKKTRLISILLCCLGVAGYMTCA